MQGPHGAACTLWICQWTCTELCASPALYGFHKPHFFPLVSPLRDTDPHFIFSIFSIEFSFNSSFIFYSPIPPFLLFFYFSVLFNTFSINWPFSFNIFYLFDIIPSAPVVIMSCKYRTLLTGVCLPLPLRGPWTYQCRYIVDLFPLTNGIFVLQLGLRI